MKLICYVDLTFTLLNWQISEDEISFLTGGEDPYDDNVVLTKLYHSNLKLLLVSEGAAGCRYYTKVRVLFSLINFYMQLSRIRIQGYPSGKGISLPTLPMTRS